MGSQLLLFQGNFERNRQICDLGLQVWDFDRCALVCFGIISLTNNNKTMLARQLTTALTRRAAQSKSVFSRKLTTGTTPAPKKRRWGKTLMVVLAIGGGVYAVDLWANDDFDILKDRFRTKVSAEDRKDRYVSQYNIFKIINELLLFCIIFKLGKINRMLVTRVNQRKFSLRW